MGLDLKNMIPSFGKKDANKVVTSEPKKENKAILGKSKGANDDAKGAKKSLREKLDDISEMTIFGMKVGGLPKPPANKASGKEIQAFLDLKKAEKEKNKPKKEASNNLDLKDLKNLFKKKDKNAPKENSSPDTFKQYKYTAYNLQKEKFSGIFIAMDEKDLAMQLSKQGLFLISSKIYTGGTPSAFWTTGTGEVSMDELATFCRQFSILITSGMSMLTSLETIKGQQFSAYFKSVLEVIYEDVKAGNMMSEAVNKHESVFPSFFRSMIGVGESSGKMDIAFDALAEYYENESQKTKALKSALSYPLFLMGITLVVFLLMMFYIVPKFKSALSSLEVTPIKITQIIYNMSDFMIANWMLVVAGIILVIAAFILYGMTPKGKYNYDKLKVTVPLLKTVNMDMITARFARSFAILLSSGLNMADALDAVTVIFGNLDVERRFRMAAEDVRVGIPLSKALAKYKIFPDLLIQMIIVGEKTATIEGVLLKCCAYFDRQANESIAKFTSAITPIMLCIMGGVLATMFIAIYSPIISIMQAF